MTTRAYMLSHLAMLSAKASREEFLAKYPNPWLVWEPGAWKAPAIERGLDMTFIPMSSPGMLPKGDVLCFELASPAKPAPLRLGRAPENEIVINDATVSREHLHFLAEPPGQWKLHASASSKFTRCDEKPLLAGEAVALARGMKIKAGGALFTFTDSSGMLERIAAQPASAPRK